ncbi:EAL domain-containing protein [Halomonas urmiana]|uniref:EAL domain-containing protein n=1 Tax=Halomonas urmiana TaxID=490901 RepID=A0A5R8MGT7_9GAMM|nr:EAL domain-containing protein [Halomonas urmiana]TLF50417.1 EAL domain-containing protein [Halomonas urmiana]
MSVATHCQSHDHVVQFYEDDAFLAEVVADYLKAGAEAGEHLLVLLTAPHLAAVLERLEASGLDTDAALASGQLVTCDAQTVLQAIMRDGMPDETLFEQHLLDDIAARAPLPTRAFGELVNLLCAEGNHEAAVRLEAFWHSACQHMPLTLLCSYALRHFDDAQDAFESICDHHSHVLPAERYSRLAPSQQLREVSRLQQQALALRREHASRLQAEATLEAAQASSNAMLMDLADHALHDGVTGLTTRHYAQQRLAALITDPPGPLGKVAVLHIDIDQLKAINDSLGLEMGDYFLHESAQRIKRCLGSDAVVSRLSSDEMVAVLSGFARTEALWPIIERLLDWTSMPVELDGQQVFTSCCIGLSLFPDHGETVQALMRHANLARRRAQQLGRRRYQLFSPALLEDMDPAPLALLSALREALPRGELELHFRPLICARGGQVVAVSVHPRWHSSRFGDIGQARWMAAAEAAGEIAPIDRWLLSNACRHARAWFDAGVELRVVVQVSSTELLGELVEQVEEALSRSGLPSKVLELELAESVLMRTPRRSEDILEKLNALGVRLTLDPFGNGQPLLGQFKNGCPFDSLKIHERYIAGCLDNPQHQAIIRSVIVLAQALGMAVVASGVTNRAQADYLRHQGCDFLEGSLWSRMEYRDTAVQGIGQGG